MIDRPTDPAILLTARRVLFLHAHPDDETLSTGGTIAMLTSGGAQVCVVTGTRGERGEVVDGPLKDLEGDPELAEVRVRELSEAMRALGVRDHRFLGSGSARRPGRDPRIYEDSGMVWAQPDIAAAAPGTGPAALSRADLAEVVADIGAVIVDCEPDVIVTYDSHGGYGHPDHVRMHEAGIGAALSAGVPVLVIEPPEREPGEGVLSVDVSPWMRAKRAALRSHRTQLTVRGNTYRLSGGQEHRILEVERYGPPRFLEPGPEA